MEDVFFEKILKEAESHYDVNLFSKEWKWFIQLSDRKSNSVIWGSSNSNLSELIKGVQVFLNSNTKVYKLEEKMNKAKQDSEMKQYELEKELKKEKLRLKYADKISKPTKPVNTEYIQCNFSTYGKCPTCGAHVENGMGRKDEECSECTQILYW